jgi:phage terminase large subunit GpA-like protein
MESWVVDHHIIDGNPSSDEDWENVTTYLQRRYPQVWGGGNMGISAITIDSSDQTQSVYNWVRRNTHTFPCLRAIKGSSEEHKPILGPSSSQEVNWRGQKWPNGIKLWSIGVDTAKDLLLGQLAIIKPGPGFVHFSDQLPREWFEQLTAEQRILAKVAGRDAYKWVKRRQRNEVLDCRNYAIHAAFSLGLHNYTDKRWTALETAVQPVNDDLFSTKTAVPARQQSVSSYENNIVKPIETTPNTPPIQTPQPANRPKPAPQRIYRQPTSQRIW